MPQRRTDALRVLLLFSDTGGGHRASALALRQELLRRNAHHHVVMDDVLLQRAFWPLSESDRIYLWAVNRAPWIWKAIYHSVALPQVYTSIHRTLSPLLAPRLRRLYDTVRPDLVVSLHPLLNHLPRRVLRQWGATHGRRHIPFATVITDLTTFHPSWVDPHVDLITVATEVARDEVVRLGAPSARVKVLGLPVRDVFRRVSTDKRALRQALGLDPEMPLVLVMSGGQGMGPVERIARAIAEARPQAQLAIVTGRNRFLRERLQAVRWPIPARVLGFVEDVHLWMGASDVLVTKAGPGTIAEAMICGLPMILYGYVPGQEEGNVSYVVNHGIGTYQEAPDAVAKTVRQWLAMPEKTLIPMSRRARSLAHPDATVEIVDALEALVRSGRFLPEGYTRIRPASHEVG